MPYVVIEQTETSVTIWDGVSKDKHLKPAGTMTIFPDGGTQEFTVGRKVALAVRLLPEEPNEQEEEDGVGTS